MAGYVDEKVAKVTLDNKGFSKNADDTVAALERMKKAFSKVNGKDATKNIASDMSEMNDTISKSTQKSEGLLSRLKGIFSRSAKGIDMSGAGQSIDRMNTDVASKTATTSSILSRLKGIFQKADNHQGFPNSIKSIDGLNSKVSGFDASPLSNAFAKAASSVQNSLSIMDIALGNVLGGMIQKAMSFTGQFFRGYGDGLAEYKNKLGSIQTIMTNTEWEIPDSSVRMRRVSSALENLNDYADKTIYSFADMTKNIGTFTAAGVSLDKSAIAIKGISNLAAASGSDTNQASMAMYQLSQALASGRVALQDWNSVVNAGMGGKLFQDRLTQTAEKMGHARDMTKSFRDSLKDGWLTSEVLLETLREFSEDQSMLDAATKVKSFGQLVDTVQEAIGSGWATTWEYFLGGFEEAKSMWTSIGDIVNPFINDDQGTYYDDVLEMTRSLGNYRNAMLKTWKDMGGQETLFNSIKNSFEIVFGVMTKFREGFRGVIGDYKQSAQVFYSVTKGIENLTTSIKNNTSMYRLASDVGKLFGNVIKTIGYILGNVAAGFKTVDSAVGGILQPISAAINLISRFLESIRNTSKYSSGWFYLGRALANVFGIISSLGRIAIYAIASIIDLFTKASSGSDIFARLTATLSIVTGKLLLFVQAIESFIKNSNGLPSIGGIFSSVFSKISSFGSKAASVMRDVMSSISNAFSSFKKDIDVNGFAPVISKMFKDMFSSVMKNIEEFKKAISGVDIMSILKVAFGGLAGFSIFKLFKKDNNGGKQSIPIIGPLLDALNDLIEKGDKIVEQVTNLLTGLRGAIDSFTTGMKTGALLMIATAITMLAFSMKVLAGMSSDDLVRSVGAIATVSYILTGAMNRLAGMKKIPPSTSMSMIAFAFSIRLMAKAMRDLSDLDENQLMKSAGGVASASLILVASMKLLSKSGKVNVGAFKMIGFVFAIRILVKAIAELAQYDFETLKQSVTALGTLMLLLSSSMRIMNGVKINFKTLLGLLVFTYSVKTLVNSLIDLSMIDYEDMKTGLIGLGFIFGALVASTQALRGAKVNLSALSSLLIFTYSVKTLVNSLIDVSMIEYEDMKTGLIGLGFIFSALVVATHSLEGAKVNLSALASLLVFTYSVKTLVNSLIDVSMIEYEDMKTGLIGLGFVFGALIASTHALEGAKVNLSALASLLVFTYSVKTLVNSLIDVSMIEYEDMKTGLIGLGFVFGALVVATHALEGAKVNLSALASILVFTYSVKTLVNSLIDVSMIEYEDMKTGLIGLGFVFGALTASVIILTNMSGSIVGALSASMVLLSFVPVLLTIGHVLTQLSSIPWDGMKVAMIGLGATLAALIASVAILSALGASSLVGAASLLMLSSSLIALAIPLQILGNMSMAQIGAGLAAMGGGLAILLAAGALATFVAPGLALLAVTLVAIGVAAVGIGAGALLGAMALDIFAKALQKLAMIGSTAVVAMVKALDAFVRSMADQAPSLVAGLVKVISEALKGLIILIPEFVNFGFKLLLGLIDGLTENVPALVSAGMKLVTELGKSIVSNINVLLTVAMEVATSFIEGLGKALLSVKDRLIPALKNTFSVIGEILLTVIGELLAPLLAKIAEVFGPVLQTIVDMITQLAPALTPIIEIIGNVLTVLIENLPGILQPIADTIKVLVDGIVAALEILAPVVETIINGIVTIIQTLAPIVQTVVDAIIVALNVLGQIFTTIGEVIKAVIQGIVDVITGIGSIIDSVFNGIQGTLEAVGGVFESVGTAIKTALEGVGTVVESVGTAIKTALEGVGQIFESIGTAIKTALEGVADIIRSVGDAAKSFGEGFKLFGEGVKLVGENGASAATGLGSLAIEVAKLGTAAYAGNLQGFTEDIKNLATACTNLGQSAASLAAITVAFAQMSTSLSMMAASVPTVTTSFDSLSTSLTTISGTITPVSSAFTALVTPIQQLQLSLTEVATSFMMFATQTMMIGTSLQSVTMEFTNIQNAVTMLGTSIGSLPVTFDSLGASILNVQTLLSTFATSLTTSATGFQQLGEAAMIGMMAMNTSVITGMATVQATMLASISALSVAVSIGFTEVSNSVTMSMTLVNATVAQSMQGIMSVIQVSMSGVAAQMAASLSQVMVTVTSTMAQLSASIMSSMTSVNATISSTTAQMNATFTQFSSTAQSIVTSLMSTLNSTFQRGMASVISTVSSGMSSVVSTVSSYSGSANSAGYSVGYQISAGVASGMNANMWAIESAANRIISKAREAARAAADIHSPSRLFAKDVGKFIPMGVAKGIGDAMPKMVDEVTDSFGKGFSDAADSVVTQGDVFATAVSDAVNGISDMLDVAIDDMNYAPTITPVVDMTNLDKMNMSDYSLDYRGRISTPTPLYGVPQQSSTSTVVNNDNSKKEYSVNVNVDTGDKPVNTKELAREIQSHIKSFDDQSRRGKGEEVFW